LSELHAPVKTSQQVLGHSSPTTTLAFYTQSEQESQRDALGKLEEYLSLPAHAEEQMSLFPERYLFPTVPKLMNPEEPKQLKRLAGRPGLEPG